MWRVWWSSTSTRSAELVVTQTRTFLFADIDASAVTAQELRGPHGDVPADPACASGETVARLSRSFSRGASAL